MDLAIALVAKESFDAYRSIEYAKFRGTNDAKATEIDKRLRQLRWTVEQVIAQCEASNSNSAQLVAMLPSFLTPEYQRMVQGQVDIVDRIQVYVESFYWIAHRTTAVICSMPGLKSFKAIGVRNVRNRLLEHPENTGGFPSVGIGWGGDNGPTIASVPYGLDKGLYVNAREFFCELERVTRRCIADQNLIV